MASAREKWAKKTGLPKEMYGIFKENPAFEKAYGMMTPDEQKIAVMHAQIQMEDNEDKARKLEKALDQATKQADPYWKSYLRVAQDEIVRSFDELKGD